MTTKTIKFASNLIPLILKGEKTLTYRYGDKYNHLTKGDIVDVYDASSNELSCQIEILSNTISTFDNLQYDAKGHEKYTSKEEMRNIFAGYYQRRIFDNELLLVIEFRLVN